MALYKESEAIFALHARLQSLPKCIQSFGLRSKRASANKQDGQASYARWRRKIDLQLQLICERESYDLRLASFNDECSDGLKGSLCPGRNRTADTAIFSRMLCQLSYLGVPRSPGAKPITMAVLDR